MSHQQTVEAIYTAFGQGDIATILGHLHPEVAWDHDIADNGVPWLRRRTGREAVQGFFEALRAAEFRKFEPRAMLADGARVVSLVDVEFVVTATGKTVAENNEIHLWQFDDEGLVAKFDHKCDTHQHWAAFNGR